MRERLLEFAFCEQAGTEIVLRFGKFRNEPDCFIPSPNGLLFATQIVECFAQNIVAQVIVGNGGDRVPEKSFAIVPVTHLDTSAKEARCQTGNRRDREELETARPRTAKGVNPPYEGDRQANGGNVHIT